MSAALSDLQGLWQRSLIAWPDGRRDTTTRVYWLQGARACIDLRQPAGICGMHALDELSYDQCRQLAQQQGFAGRLDFDGSHYQWAHSIDFQPSAASADAGTLHWDGELLVETGRDLAYVEHWQRQPAARTLPAAAVALRDADDNTAAALLRVGAHFMFARDRASRAGGNSAASGHGAGHSLADCVAGAATLQQARALVDCEISFGNVGASGFRISASTLPWRIGSALEPQLLHGRMTTMERAPNGAAFRRGWQIIGSEGEFESAWTAQAAGVAL